MSIEILLPGTCRQVGSNKLVLKGVGVGSDDVMECDHCSIKASATIFHLNV